MCWCLQVRYVIIFYSYFFFFYIKYLSLWSWYLTYMLWSFFFIFPFTFHNLCVIDNTTIFDNDYFFIAFVYWHVCYVVFFFFILFFHNNTHMLSWIDIDMHVMLLFFLLLFSVAYIACMSSWIVCFTVMLYYFKQFYLWSVSVLSVAVEMVGG